MVRNTNSIATSAAGVSMITLQFGLGRPAVHASADDFANPRAGLGLRDGPVSGLCHLKLPRHSESAAAPEYG